MQTWMQSNFHLPLGRRIIVDNNLCFIQYHVNLNGGWRGKKSHIMLSLYWPYSWFKVSVGYSSLSMEDMILTYSNPFNSKPSLFYYVDRRSGIERVNTVNRQLWLVCYSIKFRADLINTFCGFFFFLLY